MVTSSARLGLKKPAGADYVQVKTQLSDNLDKLDSSVGAFPINDGVVPPTADHYAGKLWRENGTKQLKVSVPNGSGGFNLLNAGSGPNRWAAIDLGSYNAPSGVKGVAGGSAVTTSGNLVKGVGLDYEVIGSVNIRLYGTGFYFVALRTFFSDAGAYRRFNGFDVAPDEFWSLPRDSTDVSGEDICYSFGMVKVEADNDYQEVRPYAYQNRGIASGLSSKLVIVRVDNGF